MQIVTRVALLTMVVVGLPGCNVLNADDRAVSIIDVGVINEQRLSVGFRGCRASGVTTDIDETASAVTIEVRIRSATEEDCPGQVVVEFRGPLGAREVIDATTGDPVPVERQGYLL